MREVAAELKVLREHIPDRVPLQRVAEHDLGGCVRRQVPQPRRSELRVGLVTPQSALGCEGTLEHLYCSWQRLI